MKKLILALIPLFLLSDADAATRVRGGYTKSGTYRTPHYRTSPDRSKYNNYSTKGNYNPYTGKHGTKDVY